MTFTRCHAFLLTLVLGVLVWSGLAPLDRLTWAMEVAPVVYAEMPLFNCIQRIAGVEHEPGRGQASLRTR